MRPRGLLGRLLLRLMYLSPPVGAALALASLLASAPVAARGGKARPNDDDKIPPTASDADAAREHLKKGDQRK